MKFFPYERFYITTSLKPEEVHQALRSEISQDEGIRLKRLFNRSGTAYFKGYAWIENFELEPHVTGRNSFVPKIKGKVEPYLNGSQILVTMRLIDVVFYFMCIWIGFACFACVTMAYSVIWENEPARTLLIPLGMIAFAYGLSLIGFKSESVDARKKLVSIFEGELEMLK